MKKLQAMLAIVMLLLCAVSVQAAQLRVFVADMNAIGVPNRDEMKATLQVLLSSRLSGDKIMAVGSAAEADVVVTGTYVTIGKVFSIDALAKTAAGRSITRSFVQGESQDELIPAVGKLAEKLSADLVKINAAGQIPAISAATVPAAVAPLAATKSDFIKYEQQVRPAPVGEFIKPVDYERSNSAGWQSKRLDGVANLMATGKSLPDGSREIFLGEARRLSYYRQGADMKLVAETEFRSSEKILSVDTVEAADGVLDIYVTIMRSAELDSQVWRVKGDALVQVAKGLPYFFRSFSLAGGPKKLYAQSMGRDTDFYGDIAEATLTGSKITLKNPVKMPRFGDLYSFNQFRDREGKTLSIVINRDNYLVVYDQNLQELWRSNDQFGGSELFFQKDDANPLVTSDKFRSIYMNQRIQVTGKGEILVGKNDGFWVLGDARSYKKGAVYNMAWNGSSLEEKWRTRDTQNYMPDYYYDEGRNELLILQTVQRPGVMGGRGASALAIKKVE
ncbi:MAG: VCBS repeat-containing protein [Geobacteraceae bacterium]|nr:VCBS repeat-containing protein [Geobacteraceae bacterium]